MGFLGWIILGLFAGTIARALMPGKTEPGGCIGTTAVGIVGALIGGYLATKLNIGNGNYHHFFDLGSWVTAIAGSMLLLLAVRAISGGPPRR